MGTVGGGTVEEMLFDIEVECEGSETSERRTRERVVCFALFRCRVSLRASTSDD